MPNPADLNGLEVRQIVSGGRKLILYSPQNTFSCAIRDGSWIRPARVGNDQLPVIVELSSAGVTRLDCTDETAHKTFIFFVPAVEYLIPLKR